MVPYKKIPLIIEAFSAMPDKRLIVIGTGPEMDKAREAAGPNVSLLGYQSFEMLLRHMQRAKAFVFAAEEDFGIAPIEAQACGTPVIAYGRGGVLETVRGLDHPEPTGVFYPEQTTQSIVAAIAEFEAQRSRISAANCRSNAERFSGERFEQEIRAFVEARLREARAYEHPALISSPPPSAPIYPAAVVPIKHP